MEDKHDLLKEKYSHLFADRGRGIEVGEGWLWIIERMLEQFEWCRLNNVHRPNPDYVVPEGHEDDEYYCPPIERGGKTIYPFKDKGSPNYVKILCIKEKFGGLRIYYDCDPYVHEQFAKAASNAECLAHFTCETCGYLGRDTVKTTGWVRNLCPKCYADWCRKDGD